MASLMFSTCLGWGEGVSVWVFISLYSIEGGFFISLSSIEGGDFKRLCSKGGVFIRLYSIEGGVL
jgi:hypothetical protein